VARKVLVAAADGLLGTHRFRFNDPDLLTVLEPHTVFYWLKTGEVAGGAGCHHLWS
jgi:hypothetical protein